MSVKIVVGANFGDEGKGMMTNWFCKNLKGNNIVIRHNGGAQAGHTVVENGVRHIFHHFGSGTLNNAPTYLARDFILNPTLFKQEYDELKEYNPKCIVSSNCLLTTPYDVLINQIIEEARGNSRHGSCGVGIFETITRNKKYSLTYIDAINKLRCGEDISEKLIAYTYERLLELDILITDSIKNKIENKNIYINFLYDLRFMYDNTELGELCCLKKYDNLIFESAQGLLLDQYNIEYFPHLTPTSTGCENPSYYLDELNIRDDIEICYISRTYMTRHGAGRLDYECKKEDINPDMYDLTNVPNPWQQTIRYGKIDIEALKERINKDSKFIEKIADDYKVTFCLTHLNETDGKIFSTSDDNIEINYTSDKEGIISEKSLS